MSPRKGKADLTEEDRERNRGPRRMAHAFPRFIFQLLPLFCGDRISLFSQGKGISNAVVSGGNQKTQNLPSGKVLREPSWDRRMDLFKSARNPAGLCSAVEHDSPIPSVDGQHPHQAAVGKWCIPIKGFTHPCMGEVAKTLCESLWFPQMASL